jgi:hypothetical protein
LDDIAAEWAHTPTGFLRLRDGIEEWKTKSPCPVPDLGVERDEPDFHPGIFGSATQKLKRMF